MQRKHLYHITLGIFAIGIVVPLFVFAQVMESSNYRIQFDSVNVGGGLSTSTSYTLEDTTGEIATGESGSSSYNLHAGYQQMNEVYLALTAAADVSLSPDLGGITGGTSNGSTAVTATTDSNAGYELSIKASSTPAMERTVGGDTIADYTPTTADPDFTFSVDASDAELAFTPEGTDVAQRFLDNTTDTCNTGSTDTTDACWDGLDTTNTLIARRTSANHPNGTETTVKFRLEIGSNAFKLEGTYVATSTITLIAL